MLCAVVDSRDGLARAAAEGAAMAELRADRMSIDAIEAALRDRPLPTILTVRPAWEGGAFDGDEEARMARLRRGAELGVEYVDIEYKAYKAIAAPRIVSMHDFEGVPADLDRRIDRMRELEPRWVKAAVTPRSTRELMDLVALQARHGAAVAVVPMGPYAEPLRVLYPAWGGPLMYASLDAANAPGQLTLREHREIYRTHEIGRRTKRLAVVGDPIAHSRSPEYHNAAFARDGIDARLVRVRLDRAADLRELMERLGLVACAVTAPHKQAVIPGETVNTVWLEGGALRGANTDLDGARAAIAGCEGSALVYGAGGAARAFVQALREAGHAVWIANRSRERAERLAAEFGARVGDAEARTIVQATSVGMKEDASVVPAARLGPGVTAIDVVYAPPETRFIRDARARGARAVSGMVMFEAQARAQHAIFRACVSRPPARA